MHNNRDEQEIAQADSWETVEMPKKTGSLPLRKSYTPKEFSLMTLGFVPKEMEDKWFIFMQNNVLFFHRSWTGYCIYKVIFEQNDGQYVVSEALVNRDSQQYNSRNNNYDIALLSWLIDGFLLGKQVPFPVPNNIFKDVQYFE